MSTPFNLKVHYNRFHPKFSEKWDDLAAAAAAAALGPRNDMIAVEPKEKACLSAAAAAAPDPGKDKLAVELKEEECLSAAAAPKNCFKLRNDANYKLNIRLP